MIGSCEEMGVNFLNGIAKIRETRRKANPK
jgi:hypothetical protein